MTYPWPSLTIGIVTYNRAAALVDTIKALHKNLNYPHIEWLISDDSSPDAPDGKPYVEVLHEALLENRFNRKKFEGLRIVTTAHNSGLGANLNNLIAHTNTDYLLQIEDDYLLTDTIDLMPIVAAMEKVTSIGMARISGITQPFHHVTLEAHEVVIRDACPSHTDGVSWGVEGVFAYYQLLTSSRDAYLYSNMPHLKHVKRFHGTYGLYPEGLKLGATEEAYAVRVRNMIDEKGLQIIVPASCLVSRFANISRGSWKDEGR